MLMQIVGSSILSTNLSLLTVFLANQVSCVGMDFLQLKCSICGLPDGSLKVIETICAAPSRKKTVFTDSPQFSSVSYHP
jgi:hypothetical protein